MCGAGKEFAVSRGKIRDPRPLDWALCYSLYVALIVLAYLVLFVVWRRVIIALVGISLGARTQSSAAYLFPMFLMGLGMFVLVMAAEPYLRGGVQRGEHVQRFGRMAVPLVVGGVAGLLVQALIT